MTNASRNDKFLICIIVVTYHSTRKVAAHLEQMLEFVKATTENQIQMIIVDNSEDSEDADYLSRNPLPPWITVLRRPDNPGFAKGCNIAADLASADWIALVNPDILLDHAAMNRVIEFVRLDPGSHCTYAVGQITNGVRHQGISMLAGVWFTDRKVDSRAPMLGPSGGFAIYLRRTFIMIGGFDEELFAWGEDADLALRLERDGVACIAIPEFFTHVGGHTLEGSPLLNRKKAWLLARNRQRIAISHYSRGELFMFELCAFFRLLTSSFLVGRRSTLSACMKGNVAGIVEMRRGRASCRTVL